MRKLVRYIADVKVVGGASAFIYAVGFLTWGAHLARHGIHDSSLARVQYFLTGFHAMLFAAPFFLFILFLAETARLIRLKRKTRFEKIDGVFRAVSSFFLLLLCLATLNLTIVGEPQQNISLMDLYMKNGEATFFAVALALFSISLGFDLFVWRKSDTDLVETEELLAKIHGLQDETRSAVKAWHEDNIKKWNRAFISQVTSILMLTLLLPMFGYSYATEIHPLVPSAWGGGLPRDVTVVFRSDSSEALAQLEIGGRPIGVTEDSMKLLYETTDSYHFLSQGVSGGMQSIAIPRRLVQLVSFSIKE